MERQTARLVPTERFRSFAKVAGTCVYSKNGVWFYSAFGVYLASCVSTDLGFYSYSTYINKHQSILWAVSICEAGKRLVYNLILILPGKVIPYYSRIVRIIPAHLGKIIFNNLRPLKNLQIRKLRNAMVIAPLLKIDGSPMCRCLIWWPNLNVLCILQGSQSLRFLRFLL